MRRWAKWIVAAVGRARTRELAQGLPVSGALRAVIGGVITSSLLTLVVVPVVYCYMDDFAQWARRRLGVKAAGTPAA